MPIDPTKNVLDLVAAESRFRDAMRIADEKLRQAETRRQDDLAAILRAQVTDNATLLSAQLDRITVSLSDRISKLEQFRYESSGRGIGAGLVVSYAITVASLAIAFAVAFVKS